MRREETAHEKTPRREGANGSDVQNESATDLISPTHGPRKKKGKSNLVKNTDRKKKKEKEERTK